MSFWKGLDAKAPENFDLEEELLGLDIQRHAQQAQERGRPQTYSAMLQPPFASRLGYIHLHEATIAQNQKRQASNKVYYKQTMRPHIVHGPAPPILSLTATTLREVAMKVNHIHEERILFVRTIYASHRMVGTNLLVEDDSGDCLLLTLYNFVATNQDPNDVFPEGTYMALLAPYMKNSGDDPTKNLFLRCDNPECVRIFPSCRSWLAAKRGKKLIDTNGLDPRKLRADGNDAFGEGRYEAATRNYSRALECRNIVQDDKLACHSNLAEVKIRQERWEAAEEHAKLALVLDRTHVKAKFRLATAQIRLNKIEEASKVVAKESDKQFHRLQETIDQLLREQEGIYEFAKMRKEASTRPGQTLSTFHSNYKSPKIQQSEKISKRDDFVYRGTIAMEAIKGNTLVSSSKALVFCPKRASSTLELSFDPYSKSMLRGATMELESELISLMHRRPAMRGAVYSLASGSGEVQDKSNENKIDCKRIQGIVTSNTFGVTDDGVESAWKRIQLSQQGKALSEDDLMLERDQAGSGLWVNESLFNHSCTPNCTWKQIGDQMFVWTTRDIQLGEELTLTYVAHDTSFSEREATFRNWIRTDVGFRCECDWCHLIRNSDELRRLEDRVHTAYRAAAELVTKESVKMAKAAERVIPSKERKACLKMISRLPLVMQHNAGADLWVMEGTCLSQSGDFAGALEAYEKAAEIKYAVRGGYSIERAKDLWRIVGASMACNNPNKALAVLSSVYRDVFVSSNVGNVEEAFRGLTLHYSLPWCQDSYDIERQHKLRALIGMAIKDRRGTKTKAKSARKKKKR